jgi:hypothetical protein
VSQSQCGWPSSQTSYASSAWWAVTRTNYLIRNHPLPSRPLRAFGPPRMPAGDVARYYPAFRPAVPGVGARWRFITHPSATGRPLRAAPYDLHVLATPPAFRLSQDQTLQLDFASPAALPRGTGCDAGAGGFAAGLISKRVCPSPARQDGRAGGVRHPGGKTGTPIERAPGGRPDGRPAGTGSNAICKAQTSFSGSKTLSN